MRSVDVIFTTNQSAGHGSGVYKGELKPKITGLNFRLGP